MTVLTNLCLLFLAIFVINTIATNAKPIRKYGRQPTMFLRDYYVPKNRRAVHLSPAVMTAYANGDMISANSFMEGQIPLTYYESEVNEVQKTDKNLDINEKETISTTETSLNKEQPAYLDNNNGEKEDEDENDDQDFWGLFRGQSRGAPNYNAFFPIMIGGYSNGRQKTDQARYPGSATAIANSFSTGKGGVASSHATAYGDPYLSSLLRNGNGLRKKIDMNIPE